MRSLSEQDYAIAKSRGVSPVYRYISITNPDTFVTAKQVTDIIRASAGKQASIKPKSELHSTVIGMQSFSQDHVYHGPPSLGTAAECDGVLQPINVKVGSMVIIGVAPYCVAFKIENEELAKQRRLIEAKFEGKGYTIDEMRSPQHITFAYLYGERDECHRILRSIREETRFVEGREIALQRASVGRICKRSVTSDFDGLNRQG